MKEKDYNINIFSEITSTDFPDDEFIQNISESILSEPRFESSSTNPEFLYSKDQMMSMWKLGYDSCQKKTYLKKCIKRNALTPYRQLRNMSIGETLQFPYDIWGTVRVAASKIKKDFSAVYIVRKIALFGEEGPIEVLRVS